MSKGTLLDKVWDEHVVVDNLPTGEQQIFIDMHLCHEVTTSPAFADMRRNGWRVLFPNRTFATYDHTVPTTTRLRPFAVPEDEALTGELIKNAKEFGINLFDFESGRQGIVHIIGPELGLTQPGMTIVCGDSHTSTHGALGNLSRGIGTTEALDVFVNQSLNMKRPKVRQIYAFNAFAPGTGPKDLALRMISDLGVSAGKGHAYEYCGPTFDAMSMEGRMTVCNLSIEGGALFGYVNPDQTTVEYLRGRPFVPRGKEFDERAKKWLSYRSDPDAQFDVRYELDVSKLAPFVTWGTNPGQGTEVTGTVPHPDSFPEAQRKSVAEAQAYMGITPGTKMTDVPVDYVFFGSCTNGRIEDLREGARYLGGNKVAPGVTAMVVPGSMQVDEQAKREGLDKQYEAAGFQWRLPGCSMCLGMNPDQVPAGKRSVSTSNRNFEGRQGKGARTILASPATAVVSAFAGHIADAREYRRAE